MQHSKPHTIRPTDNSPAGRMVMSRKSATHERPDQPSPDHTLEPFYQPSNMEALHRSIEEMLQGKTVTRTLEELTALEDD